MLRNTGIIARTAQPEHAPAPSGLQPLDPPRGAGGRQAGEARVAFRDGERAGELEILSFDASGACTVHRVGGLGLANLLVKAAEAQRRGMA